MLFTVCAQLLHPATPVCDNVMCPDVDRPVAGGARHLVVGEVTMLGITRNGGNRKLLSPVISHSSLRGRDCRAILAHQGSNVASGHWLMFAKVGRDWWRVDTALPSPLIQDPFSSQISLQNRRSNITLDGFFYC